MRGFFAALLFIITLTAMAQNNDLPAMPVTDSLLPPADPKYREDQFYASITYNLIQGKPRDYSQYSVSTGLGFGFLRDMPINKKRNHSIAIGLGYNYNNIKHSLVVGDTLGQTTYEVKSKTTFTRNKLVLHYLDLPIEFRWRNSNDVSHEFWRVYAGIKLSYLFYDKAFNESEGKQTVTIKNDANLNRLAAGLYVAAGYNTWNFYAYYGLTSIYDEPLMESGEKLKLRSLNLGLMFYIL